MRIIVEALGHRIFDLELMVPVRKPESASSAAPDRDPHSTTGKYPVAGGQYKTCRKHHREIKAGS